MIFTRRFGALAARPQFPDAPELTDWEQERELDLLFREHEREFENDRSRNESAA